MNLILFILDYTIFLPITLIRLILIYFYGAKYNIEGFEFMDVMTHADNKYFNQTEEEFKVDTIKDDLRYIIYNSSKLSNKQIEQINKIDEKNNDEIINETYHEKVIAENEDNNNSETNAINAKKIKTIYDMLIEENNLRVFSDDLDEEMPDPNKKID